MHLYLLIALLTLGSLHTSTTLSAAEKLRIQSQSLEDGPPPQLDGVLDDDCWQKATVISSFSQVFPLEGATPSERTEIRFLHDHRHLYIAIRCYDRERAKITARELQRDSFEGESFPADDFIQIVLDPFGRERDGYLFAVNPLGAMTDGRIENGTVTMVEWDGLWDARARIDEQGWVAEIKIPFDSLSFDPSKENWGVNVQRIIRRREEMIRLVQPSQSRDGDWLSKIASLEGLSQIDQGLGFELRPHSIFRYTDNRNTGTDSSFDAGFDASWMITPAMTATVTVNTDFAEAEADVRQVNLSRFPLFFPEKRSFFLRDAPYFSFPGNGGLVTPFFSRTIGRSIEGAPVDILAGGKFTGRAGPYTFGLLDVQQRGYDGMDDKNLLAARVTRELSDDVTLGLLVTNGNPYADGDNTVLGTDVIWRTTEFMGDKNLDASVWFLGSDDSQSGHDAAFGTTAYYTNEPWAIYGSLSQIGRDFNPALGFLSRQGVREYLLDISYRHPVNKNGLRSFSMTVIPYLITNLDNKVESAEHTIPGVRWTWDSGDEIGFWVDHKQEQLFEDFELRPGINIPTGNYTFHTVNGEYIGAKSRTVSASIGFEAGEFYEGKELTWWTGLDYRPSSHVHAAINYNQYGINLPQGDFTTHLITVELNLALNSRLSWNTLAQYDNESETFGVNSRLRWTVRPGTDVHLIVNQGYVAEDRRRLRYLQSESAIKAVVTWRF